MVTKQCAALAGRVVLSASRSGAMGVDECPVSWLESLPWDASDVRSHLYKLGERGSGYNTESRTVQDFRQLHKGCLDGGTLFEDPEFPCTRWTAWGSAKPRFEVQWLRPKEICANPKFFVNGASRFDVKQGSLGNCWMVATVASLTLNKVLFNRVVPPEQSFENGYAGIFHFRIWKANRWLDVVVDDRLPCTEDRKLMYIRSHHEDEFWSALLEKAYAKLHGSYGSLISGYSLEAMEDMTGGVAERIDIRESSDGLFRIMQRAYERSSLMIATIKSRRIPEEKLETGLVAGHSYSITSVRVVMDTLRLVRLRNPWGDDIEWNGPWGDSSPEWTKIPASERESMGLTFEEDGEFWISMEDFVKQFHFLDICNLGPEALREDELLDDSKKKWEVSIFEGAWVAGATAGGSPNYIKTQDTFCTNPQFFLTIEQPDVANDEPTTIVALLQKNRRRNLSDITRIFNLIGFAIYKADEVHNCPAPLDMSFFRNNSYVARSRYINYREVTSRISLAPGSYCIVPSTYYQHDEGEFLLRIFTEVKSTVIEHDRKLAITQPWRSILIDDPDSKIRDSSEELDKLFHEAAGSDLEVDAHELQQLFASFFKDNCPTFSLELSRSMVAVMDHNRTGKLDLKEFKCLWAMVMVCKSAFERYKDQSGFLSTLQLRQALQDAGYTVSGRVLQALVLRYRGKRCNMAFEDFVAATVKLRSLIELFNAQERLNNGRARFTMSEWLASTIYC